MQPVLWVSDKDGLSKPETVAIGWWEARWGLGYVRTARTRCSDLWSPSLSQRILTNLCETNRNRVGPRPFPSLSKKIVDVKKNINWGIVNVHCYMKNAFHSIILTYSSRISYTKCADIMIPPLTSWTENKKYP